MRTLYYILTIAILSALAAPVALRAQNKANASASVTVTVLPVVGVEIQRSGSIQNELDVTNRGFDVKVSDTGKYSLQILDASNNVSTISKELGTNSTHHFQNGSAGSKQIVQLALLSS